MKEGNSQTEKLTEILLFQGQEMIQLDISENCALYGRAYNRDPIHFVAGLIQKYTSELPDGSSICREEFKHLDSFRNPAVWIFDDYRSANKLFTELIKQHG